MKKLMVAIAAAATALGLYAAGVDDEGFVSGTSFDDAGAITALDALNAYDTGATWSTDDSAAALEVKEYASGEALTKDYRPLEWSEQIQQKNYLNVKTALDKPLTRVYAPATDLVPAHDFYVDTLVKFTACDEEITTLGDDAAKIAVWVKEDEDAGTTNLMITAGYIENENGAVSTTNYNCGSFTTIDAWHRLTIKAIDDIAKKVDDSSLRLAGFVVFIDGNAIGDAVFSTDAKGNDGYKAILTDVATLWDAKGQLFPSLKGKTAHSISALAVAGQGGIDDISFTATAPEWANKAAATITWDTETVAWVSIDGGTTKLTTGSLVVEANKLVTITAQAAENYMITSGTGDWTPTTVDKTREVVAAKIGVTIGDQKFATFADAIAYINGTTASGDLVVNFASDFNPQSFATTITPGANVTSLTIDLAGKTLTYTGTATPAISCAVPLTINDSSDPDAGKIEAASLGEGIDMISCTADLTITGGIFDGSILCYNEDPAPVLVVTGGKFLSDDDTGFYLWDGDTEMTYGDKTYEATYGEGYWTVKEVETFTVTWDDSDAYATAEATVDGDEINPGDAFPANTEVEFTVTPDEGYEYATEPTGWTLVEDGTITKTVTVVDQNLTVEIPVATVKTYAVTWDDTEANAVAVAKVYGLPIENGQKFAQNTEVAFTVTPDENYEYATAPGGGWTLEEDGTITQIFTVGDEALDVEIPAATEKQQDWPDDPTDWNGKKASEVIPGIPTELENADAGTIAKWAKNEGNVDFKVATGIKTEAFLLNIDNASNPEQIQEAKDAFKITAITVAADGTVTITGPDEADYNGKVTVEGKEALTDEIWHPKADNDQFFRATLTVKEIPE